MKTNNFFFQLNTFFYWIKKFLIVYLPIYTFFLIAFVGIAVTIFDHKKDTTVFLSIGFGMLIGLSSVCFSWAKTVGEKEEENIKTIKTCGECFLLSAIAMVVAITLKYFSIQEIDPQLVKLTFIAKLCFWLSSIIVLTVSTYFFVAFAKLLHLLFERVDNKIRDL